LSIQSLHQPQDGAKISKEGVLVGLLRYLVTAEEARVFVAQTDDLLDEVEPALGQDNPIMEATPFIKVMLEHADAALEGDELLRTGLITPTPALALPIPSIGV
jgi:hypothetical protein